MSRFVRPALTAVAGADDNSTNTASAGGTLEAVVQSNGYASVTFDPTATGGSTAFGMLEYEIRKLDGTLVSSGALPDAGATVQVPAGTYRAFFGFDADGDGLERNERAEGMLLAIVGKRVKIKLPNPQMNGDRPIPSGNGPRLINVDLIGGADPDVVTAQIIKLPPPVPAPGTFWVPANGTFQGGQTFRFNCLATGLAVGAKWGIVFRSPGGESDFAYFVGV